MRITDHAIYRFMQRTGCKSRDRAVHTLVGWISNSVPVSMRRTAQGKIELWPKNIRWHNGWALIIEDNVLITVYSAPKDQVLPARQ